MWWIIAILVGIALMIFGVIVGAKSDDEEIEKDDWFVNDD